MATAVKLKTTVVCTSANREYFDFLPPLGLYLDAGQEFSHDGDIFDWLRLRSGGGRREKALQALNYALDNNLLEIKDTPSHVYYDATAEKSQIVDLDNGGLRLTDVDGTNPVLIGPPTTAAPTTTAAP